MSDGNNTGAIKRRPPAPPWRKGQSGNPNGRPKIPPDVREMLKAATVPAAQLLADVISDPTAKTELRIDAARTVLDRVYGKAVQPIDGSIQGALVSVSAEDRQLLQAVAARLEIRPSESPKEIDLSMPDLLPEKIAK